MKTKLPLIQQRIYEIRGQRVMFDFDLALLYQVETRALNQAVKRNKDRFPKEFMFKLSPTEWKSLRSQFVILENGRGKYSKYLPIVFTEYGVGMLASVLRSAIATKMNIVIVRAFISLKKYALQYKDLERKIHEIEIEYDHKFTDLDSVLDFLLQEKKRKFCNRKEEKLGLKDKLICDYRFFVHLS